jgi:hypothetical protein
VERAVIEKFASRVDKIFYLAEEVEFLKGRVQEHGTGTIITAIGVMEHRIEELKQELRDMEKQHVWHTLKNERS